MQGSPSLGGSDFAQKPGGDRSWLVHGDGGTGCALTAVGEEQEAVSLWVDPCGTGTGIVTQGWGSPLGGCRGVRVRGGFGPVPPARAGNPGRHQGAGCDPLNQVCVGFDCGCRILCRDGSPTWREFCSWKRCQ